MKKIAILSIIAGSVVFLGVLGGSIYLYGKVTNRETITTFEECAAKGYPIMESFPEQCKVPGGKTFTKSVANQPITITGVAECLPHKNTDGPQTLECAFGIKDSNGNHYGLNDPDMKYVIGLQMGKTVRVTGAFTASVNSIYNTIGTITITSVAPAE